MLYNECPSGGIGRRPGLKILWEEIPVSVRPRPWAPESGLKPCVSSHFSFIAKSLSFRSD